MPRSNDGMPCAKVGVRRPFLAMRHPFLGMRRPFLAMRRPLLPMHRSFVAMPYAFAATRCEGEDARHEESLVRSALHSMPDPCRGRGSQCVGSSSERETTRHAYIGVPESQSTVERPRGAVGRGVAATDLFRDFVGASIRAVGRKDRETARTFPARARARVPARRSRASWSRARRDAATRCRARV
jgi:hypothetical protein